MKRTAKRIVYNIIVFSLLAIGIIIVCYRFLHLGDVEYTDNAVVCQHITPINTRVTGFIKEIRFEENQRVKAGDTLVVIEDAEFLFMSDDKNLTMFSFSILLIHLPRKR